MDDGSEDADADTDFTIYAIRKFSYKECGGVAEKISGRFPYRIL